MASRIANGNMAHTAGIYADMSLDGPDIGTLVAVVDRARNLPNRKTMGKQNPYCAARDQELRFTVHDSLDYKQLKVSVFNDDKRTDLIGETWVPLEKVIVPGGGQSDIWHSLNCKGRYAGEIRIELTYYDTRPKEEADPHGEENLGQFEEHVHEIGGPRQPKALGQRPLPANPTAPPARAGPWDHFASPQPSTIPQSAQLNGASTAFPVDPRSYRYQPEQQEAPGYNHTAGRDPATSADHTLHFNSSNGVNGYTTYQDDYPPQAPYPTTPDAASRKYSDPACYQQQNQRQGIIDLPELPPHQPKAIRPHPRPISQQDPYSMHSGAVSSNPQILQSQNHRSDRFLDQNHRHSLPSAAMNPSYQQPPRQRSFDQAHERSSAYQPHELDAPPPPPVHRSSGGRVSAGLEYADQPPQWQHQPSAATPAPLHIRGRKSASPSPLANGYTEMPHDDFDLPGVTGATKAAFRSAPTTATYPPLHFDPRRVQPDLRDPRLSRPSEAHNRPRSYIQTTPPSLIAGMNQSAVRDDWERRASAIPNDYHITPPRRDRASTANIDYDLAAYSGAMHRSPSPQPLEQSQHSPTPYLDRREVASDPRQPKSYGNPPGATNVPRKSIPPQPAPTAPPQFSAFNPDSFDALNPNLAKAKSINNLGPKYTTPDQIRQSAADLAKEQLLEASGPIIGSDGRVIDPSDHLPSDTWAPEPEQKPPRKGPEVTFRFRPRDMPTGPRSGGSSGGENLASSRARETIIRPTALRSSPHADALAADPTATSPTPAGRTRLQKKTRLSPHHAASSPLLPTTEYDHPAQQQQQQHHASSPSGPYPLRERPNYGYGPPGHPGRAVTEPPPVPAKVPLAYGQEDWDRDVMEEEMRRLHLGRGEVSSRSRPRYAR